MSPVLTWLTSGWAMALILVLVVFGLVSTAQNVIQIERDLIETLAVEDAARYSDALREFRTLYSSEVVERAMASGTRITHDYTEHPGALPLPATLSMLLGKRLAKHPGGDVRLYSDYPFPWRSGPEVHLDNFQSMALKSLRQNPDKPVLRFEERDGQQVVRYATADQMRESCVECHNTHPDSPKRDWIVGDVRGVLEISRPIASSIANTRLDLRTTVRTLVGISTLALLGFGAVVTILRRLAQHSQELAANTAESNRLLALEIQQRQYAEDQAISAQKLESLGLLAGGIAHDFNNLLTSILGHLELATHKSETKPDIKRHLEPAQQAGERAKNLIKQMLTYAGKHPIVQEPVNLTQRIEQITHLMIASSRRTAHIIFETEPDLPMFMGDPAQIDQIFMNLVTNAAEAIGEEPGTITIRTGLTEDTSELDQILTSQIQSGDTESTDQHSQRVFLEVEDTGCGMSDEARKRMLDPFFSTKGPGRGLGLASLQGITRSHNGIIHIASSEGEGTLVRIEFPVDGPPVHFSAGPAAQKTNQHGDGCRVLVVDDDDDARNTTAALLQYKGFTVETAASGQAAIDRVQGEGPEVHSVVLDMSMPQMSGVETYREIRLSHPDVHVVFISGFFAHEEIRELVQLGQVQFVQKPFLIDELASAILSSQSIDHPTDS